MPAVTTKLCPDMVTCSLGQGMRQPLPARAGEHSVGGACRWETFQKCSHMKHALPAPTTAFHMQDPGGPEVQVEASPPPGSHPDSPGLG